MERIAGNSPPTTASFPNLLQWGRARIRSGGDIHRTDRGFKIHKAPPRCKSIAGFQTFPNVKINHGWKTRTRVADPAMAPPPKRCYRARCVRGRVAEPPGARLLERMPVPQESIRAMVFIDGSNWYHALRAIGVRRTGGLDYAKISRKLAGRREWLGTRYYGVVIDQRMSPRLYAESRRFHAALRNDDPRITVRLGRLERRPLRNPLASELRAFLDASPGLSAPERGHLTALITRYQNRTHYVEKGVDVSLAVDLVRLANEDVYDAAYLLSADGDYVPAVQAVRALGKAVYAVCPSLGSALAAVTTRFLVLRLEWFADCYRAKRG